MQCDMFSYSLWGCRESLYSQYVIKKKEIKEDVSSLALFRERDEKNTDVQMSESKQQADSSPIVVDSMKSTNWRLLLAIQKVN